MFSRLFGRSHTSPARAYSLAEGASRAYEGVRREGLPLAHIAEQHPLGAEIWFADSLLRLGAVFGRLPGESGHVHLALDQVAAMTLAADMTSLSSHDARQAGVTDLRVLPSELKRYLRWARTVQ